MLALTRRPNQGFRVYVDGQFVGTIAVRPGYYPGETKVLFDLDRRVQIHREELPPRDPCPPPTPPVREEHDGDDASTDESVGGVAQ